MSPLLTDSFNVSALEMIFQNDIQNLSEFNSQCLDAFLDHSDFFKHFNSPRYLKAIGFNTLAPNRCITLSVIESYLKVCRFQSMELYKMRNTPIVHILDVLENKGVDSKGFRHIADAISQFVTPQRIEIHNIIHFMSAGSTASSNKQLLLGALGGRTLDMSHITDNDKVVVPIFKAHDPSNTGGHFFLIQIDFTNNRAIVHDFEGTECNHIDTLSTIMISLRDLYSSQGTIFPEWTCSFKHNGLTGSNSNCGVAVMLSCFYILLNKEVNFYGEDLNLWRKRIAWKLMQSEFTPPPMIVIDLTV